MKKVFLIPLMAAVIVPLSSCIFFDIGRWIDYQSEITTILYPEQATIILDEAFANRKHVNHYEMYNEHHIYEKDYFAAFAGYTSANYERTYSVAQTRYADDILMTATIVSQQIEYSTTTMLNEMITEEFFWFDDLSLYERMFYSENHDTTHYDDATSPYDALIAEQRMTIGSSIRGNSFDLSIFPIVIGATDSSALLVSFIVSAWADDAYITSIGTVIPGYINTYVKLRVDPFMVNDSDEKIYVVSYVEVLTETVTYVDAIGEPLDQGFMLESDLYEEIYLCIDDINFGVENIPEFDPNTMIHD